MEDLMAKIAIKNEKRMENLCSTCYKPLVPMTIMAKGKKKTVTSCDCGLFMGNEKIR